MINQFQIGILRLVETERIYALLGSIISFNSIVMGSMLMAIIFIGGFKELDIFKKYIVPFNKKYSRYVNIYFGLNIISVVLCMISFIEMNTNTLIGILTLEIALIVMALTQINKMIEFSFSTGSLGRSSITPIGSYIDDKNQEKSQK